MRRNKLDDLKYQVEQEKRLRETPTSQRPPSRPSYDDDSTPYFLGLWATPDRHHVEAEEARDQALYAALRARLPALLPSAIAWAEQQSAAILDHGRPLDATWLAIAKSRGVQHPERIRFGDLPHLAMPEDPELVEALRAIGMVGPAVGAVTLGYGMAVMPGLGLQFWLLAHEFRHVHQFEAAGSLAAYLTHFLQQVADHGYGEAPYEMDARAHENP